MAHITNIEISGLLGRDSLVKESLDRYVNVFFGFNGSGKTSLLKILASSLGGKVDLRKIPFSGAKVGIYSLDYDKVFLATTSRKSSSFVDFEDEFDELDYYEEPEQESARSEGWNYKPSLVRGKKIKGQWRHTFLATNRLIVAGGRMEKTESDDDFLNQKFAAYIKRIWSVEFSEVISRVKEAQTEALQQILLDYFSERTVESGVDELDPAVAYSLVQRFLSSHVGKSGLEEGVGIGTKRKFSEKYRADLTLKRVVLDIYNVENKIEAEMRSISELQNVVASLFSGGKTVEFFGPNIVVKDKSGADIDLALLSSGEKHLLRILIAAIEAGKGILFIDEPELSLHIDWQRDLIGVIRRLNPDVQIIVATHSPEIMAKIGDENIFTL